MTEGPEYLLAGRNSELDRLQLQSRVWEPAGRTLLAALGDGTGRRVLDVGCGCLGWLRVLAEWVGHDGAVVGTDVDATLLAAAERFVADEGLTQVTVRQDDLFDSALDPRSFDLVHARFQIAPLGRADDQLDSFMRLVAPGGVLVLEDPDSTTWRCTPPAPAFDTLVALILRAFRVAGGDFDAGRSEAAMLRDRALAPTVRTDVVELAPGHPYLRLPLQFATSLEPRLLTLVPREELDALRTAVEHELSQPGRSGTTFTLVQTWATLA